MGTSDMFFRREKNDVESLRYDRPEHSPSWGLASEKELLLFY